MPPSLNLVIRDAGHGDHAAIVHVLAAAFADGAVARWIESDPTTRYLQSIGYFDDAVAEALASGVIRLAVEGDETVAAALWIPHPPVKAEPSGPEQETEAMRRLRLLGELLAERHPDDRPHHCLTFLGVRPDRQNRGIGSYLLDGHHALLDATVTPAYLEANDPRNHELYLRHGYTDVGAPVTAPGSSAPVWPMWRQPTPRGGAR